ncbi:hypothetical protein [Pseudomonas sp. NPDC089401]|uniref:hypothetical protein n=1 Tax=Pseudomonas sp. NPDC089401 TaxID=3364462 RepID=UPI0038006DD8
MFSPHLLLTGLLSLSVAVPVFAAGTAIKSGWYEALMLAVTPDHQVEGYYSEERGEGVTFHCAFFLQGQVADAAKTPVKTWSSEVFPGSVAATADGVMLTIKRGTEHDGCMNVMFPGIADGLELGRLASKPWIGLLTLSADKAYLQKRAGGQAVKGPYIVKNDVVGVLVYKDGWAQVEYMNTDARFFKGWVRQDQFSRLQAP